MQILVHQELSTRDKRTWGATAASRLASWPLVCPPRRTGPGVGNTAGRKKGGAGAVRAGPRGKGERGVEGDRFVFATEQPASARHQPLRRFFRHQICLYLWVISLWRRFGCAPAMTLLLGKEQN